MCEQFAYKDATLPIEKRVEDLLSRMTLEEKVGQLCQMDVRHLDLDEWIKQKKVGSVLHILGEDCNRIQELALSTRLGIPVIFGIDAIHGNAFWPGATIYPSQLGLSSSWNTELIEKVAQYTARETAATGAHWTFSPVLCLARDLRWGRIDETFGEDSFLISEFGKAMVRGYQGEDVSQEDRILACAKHFAGYSETQGGRDSSEADLSRKKMYSLFLPPFEAAVKAGCKTFMAAYQALDGIPCSANSWLLTDVLRKQWGFTGFVVSDWDNIGRLVNEQFVFADFPGASGAALKAGNDMAMVTPTFYEAAIEAVKSGMLEQHWVDTACRRILQAKFEIGLFDGRKLFVDKNRIAATVYCNEHKAFALETAYQSAVLLKNNNRILPLRDGIKHIALIGPNADDIENQLGDWSSHSSGLNAQIYKHPAENIVTIYRGIKQRAGSNCRITYAKGCGILPSDEDNIPAAVQAAAKADVVILVPGDNIALTGERRDRANLDLSGRQMELFRAVRNTGKPVIVVLINSKPLCIPEIADKAEAILECWNPGMEGGTAIAGLLFGDRSPGGKLTISFPHHTGQLPVYYNQLPGWHAPHYADMPESPLFAFGYGLSYTEYSYSNLVLSKSELKAGENLCFTVDVENTGKREGVEIVQVYINDLVSSVTTPVKSLKAFQRIKLKPGEKQTVRFSLPYRSLSLVNSNLERIVEPGTFMLMAGSSSQDKDLLKINFIVRE